jgi:hypothetical protein
MPTPLRIRITDSALRPDLVRSLAEGNCAAVQLLDGTVEVTHREAADDREARLELAFFVGAWLMRHPNVSAELVS